METTEKKAQHTPGPWRKGYPPHGITGPNTPVISGVTVHEAIAHREWEDRFDAGEHTLPCPPNTHVVVTKGQDTIAIACGDVEGIDAEANARLIAAAPLMLNMLQSLSRVFNDSNFTDRHGYGERIDAIIAQAEGRE